MKNDLPFKEEIIFNTSKKVFNNSKVESHSAIMPTYIIPKNLTPDERLVYDAIKNRFISQFMKEAQYENTEIVTTVPGENYERLFKTKGKILKCKGWLKLYKEKKKDELLPPIEKDDEVEIKSLKIISKRLNHLLIIQKRLCLRLWKLVVKTQNKMKIMKRNQIYYMDIL